MKKNITPEARNFLLAGSQLLKTFADLLFFNNISLHVLNEAVINLSEIKIQLQEYNNYFKIMLQTPPLWQDWNFIKNKLENYLNKVNRYFNWIENIEKSELQITEKDIETLVKYKMIIEEQIEILEDYCE